MSDHTCPPVSVTLTIDAPADRLFAILASPANHPRIDGSGMLTRGPDTRISAVGDVFTMSMHNDEMGHYEIANHVVEYELNRRITWEPVLESVSREEDKEGIGERNGVRWGYELDPVDARSTHVTETYDCSAAPDWLRNAVKNGVRWVDSMTESLAKLEELAEA